MLGGDTVHLGPEPDLAALYEMAVGGVLLPEQIDTGDYTALVGAPLGIYSEAIAEELDYGRQEHLDVSWQVPLQELLDRAIAAGHRDQSITALVEVLRKPAA